MGPEELTGDPKETSPFEVGGGIAANSEEAASKGEATVGVGEEMLATGSDSVLGSV